MSAPKVPTLKRGTDSIKQAAFTGLQRHAGTALDRRFPHAGAHLAEMQFMRLDRNWQGVTGITACLTADFGGARAILQVLKRPGKKRPRGVHPLP